MRKIISSFVESRPTLFLLSIGFIGLALIGGGAYIGSQGYAEQATGLRSASIALETVGGAVLAAVVVGLLIDQVTRHKLSRDTGEQWLWALLGEDTPPALRERAKEVISQGHAYLSVDFDAKLTWVENSHGKALRLQIHVITDGVNHSRKGDYLPDAPTWAMPSVGEHKTRHVKWLFEIGDPKGRTAVRRLSADNGLIERHSHDMPPAQEDFEPDGSVFLDQKQLIEDIRKHRGLSEESCSASPGERFRLERDLEVFLDPTDFFPFFILVPTVEVTFKFHGDACRDLAIKSRAGGANVDQSRDEAASKEFQAQDALLPGHVVIFSWHPRIDLDVDVAERKARKDANGSERESISPSRSQ